MNVSESFLYREHMALYGCMFFMCLVILAGNGLIITTFIQQPGLRKKGRGLYLIGCLAVADFITGIGFIIMAIFRLRDRLVQVRDLTRFQCLLQAFLPVSTVYLSHTWTAMVAYDRFQAMAHPFKYQAQNSSISKATIVLVYLFAFFNTLCIFLGIDLDSEPESCRLGGSAHKLATLHYSLTVLAIGSLVFFFYIRALVALRSGKVMPNFQNQQSAKKYSFEVKVTKTTAMILGIYCIVWFTPNIVFLLTSTRLAPQLRSRVTPYIGFLGSVNSALNVFVYATKSSVIRPYLMATVKNKFQITTVTGAATGGGG